MIEYQEPNGGNMALHFAVLKGNSKIINMIINDLGATPMQQTKNGLNVLHCAAQFERGTLSIENFMSQKNMKLDVNGKDNYGCSPIHFAVMNM